MFKEKRKCVILSKKESDKFKSDGMNTSKKS